MSREKTGQAPIPKLVGGSVHLGLRAMVALTR
jgi:hypothetical protein